MRISDWSSDVCSSDLVRLDVHPQRLQHVAGAALGGGGAVAVLGDRHAAGRHHELAGGGDVIAAGAVAAGAADVDGAGPALDGGHLAARSEEHTSELQSLMRISYAVFCLKNKKKT